MDFLSSTSVRKCMKIKGKEGNQKDRLAQRRGGAERFFALLRIRILLFLRAPSRARTRSDPQERSFARDARSGLVSSSDTRFSKSYECLASRHLPVQMGCKPVKVRGLGTRRFRPVRLEHSILQAAGIVKTDYWRERYGSNRGVNGI